MKNEESGFRPYRLPSLRGSKFFILHSSFFILLFFVVLAACSSDGSKPFILHSSFFISTDSVVDKLNARSYAYHYRNIDSTEHYARQVFSMPDADDDQRAEALNNLAFVSLARMDYDQAQQQLEQALALTDNYLELLVAEVQLMRLCQRRSDNRAFYEHREQATKHLNRIDEERGLLTERQRRRLIYAESELAIVNSTYYYYVGLERQSVEALQGLNLDEMRHDTAQYLNYLYNVGAGGVLTEGTPEDIFHEEVSYLNRCLAVSLRHHYPYFEAQAKEGLAEHTADLGLAEEALDIFSHYGDIYQTAGAYRTLASCCHALGDDQQALEYLHQALADSIINQAPDLVASIREQLSVAYSAVNDKAASDYNRNIYIDLQEQTRQDRELEARAGQLDKAIRQLNGMLIAVVGAIVLLLFLLWFFNRLNRRNVEDRQLDELLEQKNEEVAEARLRVERLERSHLEQRAKVSLAVSITPFIDRIVYAISRLDVAPSSPQAAPENSPLVQSANSQIDYLRELTDKINEQNELLTQWIQLRQGELRLHIESFPLQPLFDLVARGKASFDMKGITLDVLPTEATVKADRVLTLFMLNTLADNARKFTSQGGTVTISADEQPDWVELSVSDNGCGMDDEQLAHAFDHKVTGGHGFGLMNCKGIIEKYRKLSHLFSVCQIAAESRVGEGTRIRFRLPKGIRRVILLLAMLTPLAAQGATRQAADYLSQAHIYADSAYFSNVNGTYGRTLQFADSCRMYLNQHYRQLRPHGRLLMTEAGDDEAGLPAEIQWLHDSLDINYQLILDIRNESAVAALALHEWALYAYNNKVYTQLFKELSADNTLADYCRTMQQSQANKRIAVILLIVILLLIVPAYYMLYYRHRLYRRHRRERMQLDNIEMADDELRRAELEASRLHVANAVLDNCLSTLKHETMYYPSRIRQLVDSGDYGSLGEVTHYYRDLYAMLCEQATHQLDQVKLHVSRLELYGQPLLGDADMLRYLFELLPGEVVAERKDDKYVMFSIRLTTEPSVFDRLLCRQIVRDHGEATHRRGCGISISTHEALVTLPLSK